MADETEKLKDKMNRLRETNSGIISEIESMGQGVDLPIARLEHFMVYLVELEIITEHQMIESQYAWEKNLKEQLVVIVRTLRQRRADMQEEARRQQREADKQAKNEPVKLVGNDRNGKLAKLVLPPGARFEKVKDEQERPGPTQEDA